MTDSIPATTMDLITGECVIPADDLDKERAPHTTITVFFVSPFSYFLTMQTRNSAKDVANVRSSGTTIPIH